MDHTFIEVSPAISGPFERALAQEAETRGQPVFDVYQERLNAAKIRVTLVQKHTKRTKRIRPILEKHQHQNLQKSSYHLFLLTYFYMAQAVLRKHQTELQNIGPLDIPSGIGACLPVTEGRRFFLSAKNVAR
ncbi:hypothetical protein FWJ25_08560 [Marinobacter salinexigens]|uniref:Uncharacterized protein n=1 Tax=Marinobacter salinexigens TaxID=2919747 RepID=A0A5B0VK09_9GAMM|nr:hypothetical protein [Marinobacter salinexigens]KAA1174281.1 hypothetical protein FWJ25_08560 [Marinobacter salinexigens]